jgi:hypothetical protein
MSCYICGGPIDDMKLDHRDMKTRPCANCERIIHETVEALGAKDKGDEDSDGLFVTSLETNIEEFYHELEYADGRKHPNYFDS